MVDRDSSSCSSSQYVQSSGDADSEPPRDLFTSMTELNLKDNHRCGGTGREPFLRIVHQPQMNFRFRYVSEMAGTHGCLLAHSQNGRIKQKMYPSVELHNYEGRAIIKCRLAQCDRDEDHPHKLQTDDRQEGAIDVEYELKEGGSKPVVFPDMGIIYTAKKNVAVELFNRNPTQELDVERAKKRCQSQAKEINLNIVRLRFSAHDPVTHRMICRPVYSTPIHNLKSPETNELKICRMDKTTGLATGYEDVFILTEKVNKKNIKVRFVELNEHDEIVWSDEARFTPGDVHHQFAIVFKTPPYRDVTTSKDVDVWIELFRPQDGRTSERMPFKYKATPKYAARKKRKASVSSLDSGRSLSSIDIPSVLNSFTSVIKQAAEEYPILMDVSVPPTCEVSPTEDYVKQLRQPSAGNAVDLASALFLREHRGVPTLTPPLNVNMTQVESASTYTGQATLFASDNLADLITQNCVEDSSEYRRALENFSSDPFKEYRMFMDSQVDPYSCSYTSGIEFHHLNATRTDAAKKGDTKSDIATPQGGLEQTVTIPMTQVDSGRNPPVIKKEPYSAKYDKKDGAQVSRDSSHIVWTSSDIPDDCGTIFLDLVTEFCEILKNKDLSNRNAKMIKIIQNIMSLRLSNGDTFLHMLVANRTIPMMEYIIKQMHSLELVSLLNVQNDQGETVLHTAIKYELSKNISFMLLNGCNPMQEDAQGHTALHVAALYSEDCLKELIEMMASQNKWHNMLNSKDNCHSTPLLLTAKYGRSGSMALLLQAGADLRLRDDYGRHAIHLASGGDHLDATRLLLQHMDPSEVDSTDANGNTALQMVCSGSLRTNTLKIAELLCQYKANPLKSSGGNSCPLKLTSEQPELLALLRKYAADDGVEIKSEPEDEYSSADESSEDEYSEAVSSDTRIVIDERL